MTAESVSVYIGTSMKNTSTPLYNVTGGGVSVAWEKGRGFVPTLFSGEECLQS